MAVRKSEDYLRSPIVFYQAQYLTKENEGTALQLTLREDFGQPTRPKGAVGEMGIAHQRQAKNGKKTSLDYKVLPTAIDRLEDAIDAGTGQPRQGHG